MKSGIFIHIGLHKTGTTTLQRFFAHNEGVFNDHGFFFPRACRENKADQIIHSNLSWELMHHGMFDPALGTHADLVEEISNGPPQRSWVISGEGLSRLPKPVRFLKAFEGRPLTVIVYVRDPVEAAPSLYSEQLKAGCIETFEPWILHRSKRWLNHDQVLAPWRHAVESCNQNEGTHRRGSWRDWFARRRPDARLIERSLEPAKLHKASLVDDFLSILKPRGEIQGLTTPPIEHHNHRISTLECVALLFMNGIQQHAIPSDDRDAIRQRNEARQLVRSTFPDCSKPFASTPRQSRMLAKLFSDQPDTEKILVHPDNTQPCIPPLLTEILDTLARLVPVGLPSKAQEDARARVARFLGEQGGIDSLMKPRT